MIQHSLIVKQNWTKRKVAAIKSTFCAFRGHLSLPTSGGSQPPLTLTPGESTHSLVMSETETQEQK